VHYNCTNVSACKFAYFLLFLMLITIVGRAWLDAKEELQNIVKGGET
jgi:hypothetical protein